MTHQLPPAWLETTIDELFRTTGGGTPATDRSDFWGDGRPWITSADIDDAGNISPRKAVTASGVASSATNPVPPGSVVVVTRVGLGKVGLTKQEVCFSQDCQALLFSPQFLDPSFVAHQIRRTVRGIRGRGTTIAGVTVKQLAALLFRLAPLAEQRRIVEAIDSYFTRLDNSIASLEAVRARLKAYRASVLKAAVEGRLVPTEATLARAEKRAYESAEMLLTSILKDRRCRWENAELAKFKIAGKTPRDDKWKAAYREPVAPDTSVLPDLPEGWCWATVEQVCSSIVDCPHSTPKWTASGRVCVRTTEFSPGRLDLNNPRHVSEATYRERIARLRPEPGDVLYSREGGILGLACQIPDGAEICLGQRMMLMRAERGLGRYLMHMLNGPTTVALVRRLTGGSASPHLNVGDIRKFPVPLPPLAEVQRVVEQTEDACSVADAVDADAQAAATRCLRLKQAVLRWAFEGRLIDQDSNDEPVDQLFARIRADRAAVTSTRMTPRRRRRKSV